MGFFSALLGDTKPQKKTNDYSETDSDLLLDLLMLDELDDQDEQDLMDHMDGDDFVF